MKKQFIVLNWIFLYLFATHSFAQNTVASSHKIAVYKDFSKQTAEFGYHKIGSKKYKIQKISPSKISYGEPQTFFRSSSARSLVATSAPMPSGPYYSDAVKCGGDIFAGRDRAIAKTHKATGEIRHFADFNSFYSSGLVIPDDQMLNYDPSITKLPESQRVSEETVNVTIDKVYIYGIYKEDDNDFHMIIGNGYTGAKMKLFNAEVSGLPDDNDGLLGVRSKIIEQFGDIPCKSGAFKPVGTLIPITITGSLFFDVDHKAGVVGFGIYKPTTAWEIHPVTNIVFLDK